MHSLRNNRLKPNPPFIPSFLPCLLPCASSKRVGTWNLDFTYMKNGSIQPIMHYYQGLIIMAIQPSPNKKGIWLYSLALIIMLFSKFHSLGFHNTWKHHDQEKFPWCFLGFRVCGDLSSIRERGAGVGGYKGLGGYQ